VPGPPSRTPARRPSARQDESTGYCTSPHPDLYLRSPHRPLAACFQPCANLVVSVCAAVGVNRAAKGTSRQGASRGQATPCAHAAHASRSEASRGTSVCRLCTVYIPVSVAWERVRGTKPLQLLGMHTHSHKHSHKHGRLQLRRAPRAQAQARKAAALEPAAS